MSVRQLASQESGLRERRYSFKGIDCPSCAAMLEDSISKMNGIDSVTLDFNRKMLRIKTKENEQDSYFTDIINQAKRVEPTLQVVPLEGRVQEEDESRTTIIRIALAVASFGLAYFFDLKLLFILSFVVSGYEVLIKAAKNIFGGKLFDENFLMTVGTLGALAIGQTGEAAAVMLLYLIGEYFQDRSVSQSHRSIMAALDMKVDQARLIVQSGSSMVKVEEVQVGQIIRVLAGEKIPLDGIVVRGTAGIDTQSLTGESVPREVKQGDEVLGSSIAVGGSLDIEVTRIYVEGTAAKIIKLVEESTTKKAQTEKFITTFARYYTPAVVFLAVALAIIPSLITGAWQTWIYRALVFLVVSCPCALVISVPLSYFAGIGKSAKSGILVRGGNYLEALAHADTMVFDKTGTLTTGTFSLVETRMVEGSSIDEDTAVKLAASLERMSNHPLAKAFSALEAPYPIVDATEVAGRGMYGVVDGKDVLIGSPHLLEENGVVVQDRIFGEATVLLAVNGNHIASFILRDTVRSEAKSLIERLRSKGFKHLAIISGDSSRHADRVAAELGLDEVHAGLLPDQKQKAMLQIAKQHTDLIFVGDGMNDAPSLAASKVGISMGSHASDAAMQSADVVILSDNLSEIGNLVNIARQTARVVRQNIFIALVVKTLALVLGSLGYASMWIAVIADTGVTIVAVLNALRILLYRPSR